MLNAVSVASAINWLKTPSLAVLTQPLLKVIPFARAERKAKKAAKSKTNQQGSGSVYLVGSGPGDAELLTLKAYRLLQEADVVLYDWLVSPEIVNMIPKKVEKIFVGKKCGRHSMKQEEICQLLVSEAQTGKNVVRLKGGDPSIFGRAAEEVDALTQANIEFAIVPGITAASGCAAYSGIPLTHRECAHSVRFVTAHFKSDEIQADWQNYADSNDTLVFYMGLNKVSKIASTLIEHGKDAKTPMAIVDQGTTKHHKSYVSTLDSIDQVLEREDIVGPALIMVGEAIDYKTEVNVDLLKEAHLQTSVA